MYYPQTVIAEVSKMIYELGVKEYHKPSDIIIGQYVTTYDLLYGTKQSLVQHIGFHSTGLAGEFHRTACFVDSFNIRDSLGGLLKNYSMGLKRNIEFILNINANVPKFINKESQRLVEIIKILLENALNYTIDGEISLSVELTTTNEEVHNLHYSIRDTGDGTQMLICKSMKDNFYSVKSHPITKRLLYVISQVKELGGEFWFNDELDNKYFSSEFHLIVPYELKTDELRGIEPINEFNNLRVVIIENNDSNREMLYNMCYSMGFNPIALSDGVTALEYISNSIKEKEPIWMILIDAVMPLMNGFEVIQEIKKMFETLPPILMMLSNEINGDKAALCREMGIYDHLNKPILYSELQEAFRYYLTERDASSKA